MDRGPTCVVCEGRGASVLLTEGLLVAQLAHHLHTGYALLLRLADGPKDGGVDQSSHYERTLIVRVALVCEPSPLQTLERAALVPGQPARGTSARQPTAGSTAVARTLTPPDGQLRHPCSGPRQGDLQLRA